MPENPQTSQPSQTRHRFALAAICAAATLFFTAAYLLPASYPSARIFAPFPQAEGWVSDWLYVYGRKAELHPDIVFLGIDSPSLDIGNLMMEERENMSPPLQIMVQGWPFSRALYGMITDRLVAAGAKVVVFDITVAATRDRDEEFRLALDAHGNHVVIGQTFLDQETADGFRPTLQPPSPSLITQEPRGYDPRVGYVNFHADYDGRVRRALYRTSLLEFTGQRPSDQEPELLSLVSRAALKGGYGEKIPPGREPTMFRFVRDIPYRSLYDLFIPRLWANPPFDHGKLFAGKIVVIGPYGPWSKDELTTPFGFTLGPEIQISALNAILTGDFLRQPQRWVDLLMIVLGGVAAFGASSQIPNPLLRTGVFVLVAGTYLGVAFALFNSQGLYLNLLGPVATLLSGGFTGLVWERIREQREKNRVRRTLERYVSKDVVKEVLDNRKSYLNTLGGKRMPLTILFSDVRGFTTITESADAEKLVLQLNEYFTEMVRIVFANRGTLDKFIGDAVMAHWGGIVTRGHGPDACRAVATALDMLSALQRLNRDWKQRGMLEFQIGLGVNHGEAICAHIGSLEKHEFTAIGDPVNLASRLEGATKEYKQDLLIGEGVVPLVRDEYLLRTVDLLQVKGKTRPVGVFAVISERNGADPAWLAPYEEGVRLYRQRAFAEAIASFLQAAELKPGDYLCEEYIRRCQAYQESPPPETWDGAFVMTKK